MIKIENMGVFGLEAAIRGMRNPMNSWGKSDSEWTPIDPDGEPVFGFRVGPNDRKLMHSLAKGGPVHAKYRRMIVVYLDITAPLYWWKEFDTYKVGTVANSCSTMHKLHERDLTLDDFSYEHLDIRCRPLLEEVIKTINDYRRWYVTYDPNELEIKGCPPQKMLWWQMIQLLPSSYNQRRTVMLNYEVLHNIYISRKDHKLDEWREMCKWIEGLPYSEVITCEGE